MKYMRKIDKNVFWKTRTKNMLWAPRKVVLRTYVSDRRFVIVPGFVTQSLLLFLNPCFYCPSSLICNDNMVYISPMHVDEQIVFSFFFRTEIERIDQICLKMSTMLTTWSLTLTLMVCVFSHMGVMRPKNSAAVTQFTIIFMQFMENNKIIDKKWNIYKLLIVSFLKIFNIS